MSVVTVTSKGQIAIPAATRKRLGIEKGTKLYVEERDQEIVIRPLTPAYINELAGVLNGEKSLSKMLLKERKADRGRER